MDTMTTAKEMVDMLRRHYLPENRPPGGIFAPEIQAPDSQRRADLIWMPITISGGRGLVGHEVKVSRADVLAELADPIKMEAWGQHCRYWWLVVSDPKLVEGLDIPEAWGVMAPPSGRRTPTMTTLRPAPLLGHDCGMGYARVASWLFHRQHTEVVNMKSSLKYADERYARLEAELRDAKASARAGGTASVYAAKLGRILHAVETKARAEWMFDEVVDDDVVEALLDVQRVRRATERLASAARDSVNEMRRILRPLDVVEEELGKVKTLRLPRGLPLPIEENP